MSKSPFSKNFLPFFLIALWGLVSVKQTFHLSSSLKQNISLYAGKTTEEKYTKDFPVIFPFSQMIKKSLPPDEPVTMVTDLDLTADPGMFYHRILAYFLYPIDLRGIRGGSPETIIFFHKKDALERIPEDYRIVAYFNKSNFVIRKNK